MVLAKLKGFEPKHKLAGANQQQFGPFWYCRLQICWAALASETGIYTPARLICCNACSMESGACRMSMLHNNEGN